MNSSTMGRRFATLTVAALFALGGAIGLAGCDSVGSNGVESGGQVRVLLTDAPFPFDLASEARVTISRVELVRADADAAGEIVVISDDDQTFNLLDLQNGVTAELGEQTVEAGQYSHARLVVEDAVVIMKDGTEYDLKVPSGRITVFLPEFDVSEDGTSEVTLDFDVSRSFVMRGNINAPGFKGFIFKPVVHPVKIRTDDGERDLDNDDEDELEVDGLVEAIGTGSVTVEGLEIQVTSETEFNGISDLAALLVGSEVEVEYRITSDGELIATKIELKDDDDRDDEHEFEIEGAISALTGTTLTVGGVTVDITTDTEFDGLTGLLDLQVGTRVEVEYRLTADGGFEATKIELDDHDNDVDDEFEDDDDDV